MRVTFTASWLFVVACVGSTACSLVSPVASIRESAQAACQASVDASCGDAAQGSGPNASMRDAALGVDEVDAGQGCEIPSGQACNVTAQCGCMPDQRCELREELDQPACVDLDPAMSETCPTTDDGTCDEPQGANTCASGTDRKDCGCVPKLAGAKCDAVAQCGCPRDATCEVMHSGALGWTARCTRAGGRAVGETCDTTSDCRRGSFCHPDVKLCSTYCSTGSDCRNTACLPFVLASETSVSACGIRCARDDPRSCAAPAVCATLDRKRPQLTSDTGDYCVKQLAATCPQHDGFCDEPRGSGLCVAGADPSDCCAPKTSARECDPIGQCGCDAKPETQCTHVPSTTRTECTPMGTRELGDTCSFWQGQCPPGAQCQLGVCRKYCLDMSGCKTGDACINDASQDRSDLPGTGGCIERCDFATQQPCRAGQVCANFSGTVSFCIVPYSPCTASQIGNGRCDDDREGGTRICATGTDPDCG